MGQLSQALGLLLVLSQAEEAGWALVFPALMDMCACCWLWPWEDA